MFSDGSPLRRGSIQSFIFCNYPEQGIYQAVYCINAGPEWLLDKSSKHAVFVRVYLDQIAGNNEKRER